MASSGNDYFKFDVAPNSDELLNSKPKSPPFKYYRYDSTFEGFTSLRLTKKGTPFIQAFCTAFKKYGDDKPLKTIVGEAKLHLIDIVSQLKSENE